MDNNDQMVPAKDPNGDVIASMPRDQLRSMFYLFSAKPDSRIKVYDEPLFLKPEDIVELNHCIERKLKTHQIDASTTSVKIGYVGSEINEFGTWAEFMKHHWQEPEKIEELVIKWDFLVNIENYAVPQRHTLLYRVSTDIKPGKLLQMLSSGNSDEFDKEEMFAAPAFCRVDFINVQLSRELIHVVDDWQKGRPSPELIPSAYYWFKKRRQQIAELLDHWLILSWALLVASVMHYYFATRLPSGVPNGYAAILCFLAVYTLIPARRFAHRMAGFVFNSLRNIQGSRVVFAFTSGDKKGIKELKQENAKQGKKFLINAAYNISLNMAATAFYAYLFSAGNP